MTANDVSDNLAIYLITLATDFDVQEAVSTKQGDALEKYLSGDNGGKFPGLSGAELGAVLAAQGRSIDSPEGQYLSSLGAAAFEAWTVTAVQDS